MRITALLENTASRPDLRSAHGLSLWIEAAGKTLLFDFGPGARFAENAEALGLDLSRVELGILSHGHYDHGGGLDVFLRRCPDAPVYLRPQAFAFHHNQAGKDIGLDTGLQARPQLRLCSRNEEIAPGLRLIADPPGRELVAPDNSLLYQQGQPDAFDHEQSLLIEEDGRLVLIGGCAHRGIVNYLELAKQVAGRYPDAAISGFHLASPGGEPREDQVRALAQRLLALPTQYHTCHCTGLPGWRMLQALMPERIAYLGTGDTVIL